MKDELCAASHEDSRVHLRCAKIGHSAQVRDFSISTASRAAADYPSAVISGYIVGI
jgi:hypothetical protein